MAFGDQQFQDAGFALKHHPVIGRVGRGAVLPNGGLRIDELQPVAFLGFIAVQLLGNRIVQGTAKIIEVILNEAFCRITVAFLDPVDITVFPDGLRYDDQTGLFTVRLWIMATLPSRRMTLRAEFRTNEWVQAS